VFSSSTDCVEEHCIWEENSCNWNCNKFTTEIECKEFEICFWAESTTNMNGKCVMNVYQKKH
jgi:hypothetical protein